MIKGAITKGLTWSIPEHRLVIFTCWAALCMIFASLVAVLVMLLWPYRATDFLNSPFPVEQTHVAPGDNLSFLVKYCRYNDRPASILRQLENNVIYNLPPIESKFPLGCHEKWVQLMVPEVPSGRYTLVRIATWRLNPFRTITRHTETMPFEIIPKDEIYER